MYLVMEICQGGELADSVKEKCLSEDETKIIITKLANALSYLHKQSEYNFFSFVEKKSTNIKIFNHLTLKLN